MKGIRGRLTLNFMLVILISVIILEVLLIYTVKQNYYGSLRGNLTNQIKISADMYSRYYSDISLEDNILYNVDAFWNQSNAKVEIVNNEGEVIMDSSGSFPGPDEAKEDIKQALKGKIGEWTGKIDGEGVMAVASPLYSDDEIVGVLRLIASTAEIDEDIKNTMVVFIAIGIFVILAVGILGVFLTNSIIIPLKEVTDVAEKMAEGDFGIKSKKRRDDEVGKLSDTLNYMADEINRKERLKNDFISSVSHELRTPLTSIMGWAITLQNENLRKEETLNDGLETIAKESERLTSMVEELLDFSKFVSGRMIAEYSYVDVNELVKKLKNQLALRAQEKNIELIVEYCRDACCLKTDANRLKQVFLNILDNALNFTDEGGKIVFSIKPMERAIRFQIEDNGCGIAEEEIPFVREKFYKGKSSASRNGIGLSICDEIVNMLKGRMDIESRLGEGTKITISLPKEVDKYE